MTHRPLTQLLARRRRRPRAALSRAAVPREAFVATLLALALGGPLPDATCAAAPSPGAPPAAPVPRLARETPAPSGRIVIQFTDASDIVVTGAGLVSAATGEAARVTARLARLAPGAVLERRFTRPPAAIDAARRRAEARRGRPLPNLNRYAQLSGAAPAGGRAALLELVRRLQADPAVARAFLEPRAVPAALGFDAFSGAVPAPLAPAPGGAPPPAVTPDFTTLQGYLNDPPEGVGAWSVAGNPGADGATVQVIDVEGAWLWTHEDLPSPFVEIGQQIPDLGWRNHGTAVMGEIRGTDNGFGVRGIAPATAVGGSSIGDQSVADAIDHAAAALAPGDVILIELHAPGPNANGSGQFGYVCMEYWQDNFDAIQLASAAGVIVCEAAGNGQQDLDDPVYQGLFDRNLRDSGAIVCGASDGASLAPAWFTNYGSRVDLHGWGFDVTTCGYGSLQGDPLPEEQWYTDGFSGTSSASPIVVGSVTALQGMVKNFYGFPLEARLARDLLVATGTPQSGSDHIGPRPSLADAWALAATGIGEVRGTVTDLGTGDPVAGARVTVQETGGFDLTAADGGYRLPLLAGTYTLSFTSFFYEDTLVPASIQSGVTTVLDVAMQPRPTVDLLCAVGDPQAQPLAGVHVTPREVPIGGAVSGADGLAVISGVPVDVVVPVLFHHLPGYGVAFRQIAVTAQLPGGGGGSLFVYQSLPAASEDFEADDGGFTADDLWSWGTPQAGGPSGGLSGSKCWGVGMSGSYPDDARGHLESPAYDWSGAPALFLGFHHWRETEGGFDGVHLEVWDGGGWEVRTPLSGYTDNALGGLDYQPGWSGSNGDWEGAVFDLSDRVGPAVRFRLVFGSDSGVNGDGFWVDEIAWDTGTQSAAVQPPSGAAAPPAARGPALAAFPNPFNPAATIAWRAPDGRGALEIDVYDVRGRHVRALLHGAAAAPPAGSVVWDGRDDAGAVLASGIYLVRLVDGAGRAVTRGVVLAK